MRRERGGNVTLRFTLRFPMRICTLKGESWNYFLNRYYWKGGWYCFIYAIMYSFILRLYLMKCCLGWIWLLIYTISPVLFMLLMVQHSLGLPTLRFVVSFGIVDVVEKIIWYWGYYFSLLSTCVSDLNFLPSNFFIMGFIFLKKDKNIVFN